MIHTVKGFSVVSEAEVDVFLEFPCFFYDPVDVDSLLSGSSAFSESNLYIWKFSRNILLKPSLKDFEHHHNRYRKSIWQNLTPLLDKNTLQTRNRREVLGVIKATDEYPWKPSVDAILCDKNWIFSKIRNKRRMSFYVLSIQHCTETSNWGS